MEINFYGMIWAAFILSFLLSLIILSSLSIVTECKYEKTFFRIGFSWNLAVFVTTIWATISYWIIGFIK